MVKNDDVSAIHLWNHICHNWYIFFRSICDPSSCLPINAWFVTLTTASHIFVWAKEGLGIFYNVFFRVFVTNMFKVRDLFSSPFYVLFKASFATLILSAGFAGQCSCSNIMSENFCKFDCLPLVRVVICYIMCFLVLYILWYMLNNMNN